MERRRFNTIFGALAAAPVLGPAAALQAESAPRANRAPVMREPRAWSFTADIAECCSCDIPCPCNFGRVFTPCHGSRLIRIVEGDHDGEDLAGISFVVTFNLGEWTRIYLDESMTPGRLDTLERLLPVAFAGFDRAARVREAVPLTVESSEDTLRFSVPESTVEMRMLPGLDGAPIRVDGLPSNVFHGYVQYESIVHEHIGPDLRWSHTGTNGFRSQMIASG